MPKSIYTLDVTITDGTMTEEFVAANPVVSRTIQIRSDQTLNQLHQAIFDAFDRWDDCHLCEFNLGTGVFDKGGARYVLPFVFDDPLEYDDDEPLAGSLTKTRLGSLGLQAGQVFWYWYDFGDNWQHRITVLAVGDVEPGTKYPRVVAETGASPPQYAPWDEEEWEDEGPEPEVLEPRARRCEHDPDPFDHLPHPRSPLLSMRQMHRLLAPNWSARNSGVRLNQAVPAGAVIHSPLLDDCRIMLRAALQAGGVKATTAGNLNRAFVLEMVKQLHRPKGPWEVRAELFPIREEEGACLLHLVRVVLELAGLLRRSGRVFHITSKGERLLPEERAGELFVLLIETLLRRYDLAELDGYENELFQATVGFSLWGLSQVGEQEWYSAVELWPLLIHPAVRCHAPQPGAYDESQSVLEGRLLRPLVWLGLLERRSIAGDETTPGVEWYRKNAMFDMVFSFAPGPV